jgi:hypothetical protein
MKDQRMKYALLILLMLGTSCGKNRTSQTAEEIGISDDTIQDTGNDRMIDPQPVKEPETTPVDTLTELEFTSLFRESARTTYDINEDSTLLTHVDKIYSYWQGKKIMVNDTLKSIYVSGYPLSFTENINRTKWLTTLTEGKNSIEVRLYTFDEFFNLIDEVSLTSSGGDQGYSGWSLGTYKMIRHTR